MLRMRSLAIPALVAGLAGGLVFAMMQINDLAFEVKELRIRLSRSEAPAPRLEATTTFVQLPSLPSEDDGSLEDDVARIDAELAALRAALGVAPMEVVADGTAPSDVPRFVAAPGAPGAVALSTGDAAVVLSKMSPEQQEQFKKAVLKVVTDQRREDEQKQRLQMASKVVADLAKALGLAGPQLDRAKQILADGTKKVTDLRKGMTDANSKQTRQDISGVWTSMDQGVRSLLTAEQVTQYDTWRTTKIAKNYFGPPASQQKPAPKPSKPGKRG